MKRWSLTSYVTPMKTSISDSTPRATHRSIFYRLSTSIFTFLEAVEPYLQRHPYTNFRFAFPSSPYVPYDLYPPLYFHFNIFLKSWTLTSNVTPTPTSYSDFPPRPTYITIFSPLYLHFKFFFKGKNFTSNVTPTPTSYSYSPPRLTYPTIFPTCLPPFYLFLEAAEPNLQSDPYTNIRFGFPS